MPEFPQLLAVGIRQIGWTDDGEIMYIKATDGPDVLSR
jgi:hypothetical protein